MSEFWTPKREGILAFFHIVANGQAIFSDRVEDAFKLTNKRDAEKLAVILHEQTKDTWIPILVEGETMNTLPSEPH